MSIAPIGAAVASGVMPTGYATPTKATADAPGAFSASLASSVDSLQAMQANSQALAIKAVSGDLADVHDYTIAATQSAVTMELTAAVRNRAVEAFQEIMRMQA